MKDISVIQNCEYCGERPGALNSEYWYPDDDDEGGWVCWPCEEQFQDDFYLPFFEED